MLKDPLSDLARRERKTLLGTSALSLFISKTGSIPKEISALGISFEKADQHAFLVVFAMVISYFLIAFMVYGFSDYLAWKIAYDKSSQLAYAEHYDRMERREPLDSHPVDSWLPKWPRRLAWPMSLARAFFEFLLPIVVAIYSIYSLAHMPLAHGV
jgi:hypothetical protein